MPQMFEIEDDFHAEMLGSFRSMEAALAYLHQLANVPWGREPNQPPCGNPECRREYVVVEYETSPQFPWDEVGRKHVFMITARGVTWAKEGGEPYPDG